MKDKKDHINTVNESVCQSGGAPKMITETQEYGTGNSVATIKIANGPQLLNEDSEEEESGK